MPKLTDEQAEQLIEGLEILSDHSANQPWNPKWGNRLLAALSNVVKLTAIEMVALRRGPGGLGVHLAERPTDDPNEPYKNQRALPGTFDYVVDPMPEPQPQVARLERKEIAPARYTNVTFAGRWQGHAPPRGPIRQEVYLARIEGEPAKGKFYPINNPPPNLHRQHNEIIAMAVRKAEELGW